MVVAMFFLIYRESRKSQKRKILWRRRPGGGFVHDECLGRRRMEAGATKGNSVGYYLD